MKQNAHTTSEKDQTLDDLPLFAAAKATPALKIMRLPEVIARVGLKRASIYRHIGEGRFPKPIPLAARAVGWFEHEIDTWLLDRLKERSSLRR
jgi:prophage regulatory protein